MNARLWSEKCGFALSNQRSVNEEKDDDDMMMRNGERVRVMELWNFFHLTWVTSCDMIDNQEVVSL